ncbi:helicase HerA-like domain-containing protein [Pedobacter sp. SYP-B3415]|uniref:helicase HerA-like domain-containing protein n=1 Tax=Pedobacter sp. SYP-B3415 TaxID=2496641 RepID=UPI00101C78B2|nr:helicase HerA-like domain-containing protein [Pedobacter sp. SYP-B3415]
MNNESTSFIEKIKTSYPSADASLYLGAGILQGTVYADAEINIPLRMMNRHGLVAGATGTGKTRTLQLLAEQLSDAGVPVFMLDVKGDLSGLNKAGASNPRIAERAALLNKPFNPVGFPVEIYSLSGKLGAPMRATAIEFGPVLLAKVLDLNETQTGVLAMLFKYADDNRLPVIDLKDLRKLVSYLSDGPGAAEIRAEYGSISTATAGTILRKIAAIEQQGLSNLFGETSFDITDLLQRVDGKGVISLLNIADVQNQPLLYSTFLLSLLVEIYNSLPEAGDPDKPKLVFFFDEAHFLFKNASEAFMEQIETVIRLIRSKGVGIFFCTQAPADIPQSVLSQLGNRIQHALRAFTPNDAEALTKTVKTYPKSDFYKIDELLTGLGTGQALITVLNEKGIPTEVAATMLAPPRANMGPLTGAETESLIATSTIGARYREPVDPESAYEILTRRLNASEDKKTSGQAERAEQGQPVRPVEGEKSLIEEIMGATITRQIGKEIVRGIFGMLTGKKTRSRSRSIFGF